MTGIEGSDTRSSSWDSNDFVAVPAVANGDPAPADRVIPKAKARAKSSSDLVIGADGRVLVAKPKAKVQKVRFYAVTSGPDLLLGVWHAPWSVLAAALPGGKLFGSGVRLWGFDSEDEAISKWFEFWESDPVRHPIQ